MLAVGFTDFYSRPYVRGDQINAAIRIDGNIFLLPPLHEGRRNNPQEDARQRMHFYSRPYARGDSNFSQNHKLIYMINC